MPHYSQCSICTRRWRDETVRGTLVFAGYVGESWAVAMSAVFLGSRQQGYYESKTRYQLSYCLPGIIQCAALFGLA